MSRRFRRKSEVLTRYRVLRMRYLILGKVSVAVIDYVVAPCRDGIPSCLAVGPGESDLSDAHAPYAIAQTEERSASPRPVVAPSSNSLFHSTFPLRLHLLKLLPTPRVSNTILLSSKRCSHLLQLHREIVSSIIIIPTLLPQMRIRPLRTDFFLFGPIFAIPLASILSRGI